MKLTVMGDSVTDDLGHRGWWRDAGGNIHTFTSPRSSSGRNSVVRKALDATAIFFAGVLCMLAIVGGLNLWAAAAIALLAAYGASRLIAVRHGRGS